MTTHLKWCEVGYFAISADTVGFFHLGALLSGGESALIGKVGHFVHGFSGADGVKGMAAGGCGEDGSYGVY